MLRDVFYYGKKPNIHPREQFAENLADARLKATTRDFWIINEFCDYKNFDWDFDFEFLPDEDVWAEDHNNVWPSQHQKDSGTWLCPKEHSDIIIYRNDVEPVRRKNEKTDNWVELDLIDHTKFDFSWHPDPTDPPFIYKWGCKFYPPEYKHVLEYHVPGATQEKYMDVIAELLPEHDKWVMHEKVDIDRFDMSWRPSPLDPPFIYVWGNKWVDGKTQPTIEYHAPGAVDKKYVNNLVPLLPDTTGFEFLENIDKSKFDFSWRPNPTSPPYIYVWGNQWNIPEDKISIQYTVEGATEYKYMQERTHRLPCMDNWIIPDDVDTTGFDFSWEPSPMAPPYIYEFATQWQKTGGPQYVVPGATEKQYVGFQKVKKLSNRENWKVPDNIDSSGFDFSWHPDDTSPPYVYIFATQWAFSGGPVYTVDGASEVKYVDDQVAIAKPDMTNWVYDENEIDVSSFDFSWHPYVEDQPYIYQFGTQWQKTGGPRYITPGADSSSPIKYIDTRILKATRLPDESKFTVLNDYKIKSFDFSWHPDETEEAYTYVFGNDLYPVEEMPTIEYRVNGSKEIKHVHNNVAMLDVDMKYWEVPDNIDTTGFNFSWKPNPQNPAYIYEFPTQHQKTGGPRYKVPGALDTKYVDTQHVKMLPSLANWKYDIFLDKESFDFSWHPDATDPPYIYAWGNQWVKAEDRPFVEYRVEGATEYRYMDNSAKRSSCMDNWQIPDDIDPTGFDFSWEPNPNDPPYIYEFGTQWQKTGGPRYVVKGATDVKYLDLQSVNKLPDEAKFTVLNNYKIKSFDFSWHPDDTEEPYIYVFGNNLYPAEECATIEYRVEGATQVKYVNDIVATLDVDMTNWEVPDNVDSSGFDFSWIPNPNDPPYIYEFGTQWQKTGGPRYVIESATEFKYLDFQKVVAKPDRSGWIIPDHVDVTDFDFSWHPDNTEPAYIYQFGTQWALTGGPRYVMEDATEVKYVDDLTAKALPDMSNWVYDENEIDVRSFDFSWHPYIEDQPYIYQFGTQHQKTGGPRYITPGADSSSPVKYIDTRILKAIRLPNKNDKNWNLMYSIDDFDFSWHPDDTEEPYVYVFGNQWYSAEVMPTVEYSMPGAKAVKYVSTATAKLSPNMDNWEVPDGLNTDMFDFSWRPEPGSPAYIHQFGTQWQKTGGPRYVDKGATTVRYVDLQTAIKLPNRVGWDFPSNIDINEFDFSWHPDDTEPAYIYQFGTQWSITGGPKYVMPGAIDVKYIDSFAATALPDKTNWEYDENLIDVDSFDFSWHPYVEDQPYIYQFGTQWQKTGGPRYITPGASDKSPVKYIDTRILKATRLPNKDNFRVAGNYKIKSFDYSWHPDDTSPPYVYVFGNNLYPAEECATIEYHVDNATEVTFVNDIVAKLDKDMTNWEVPDNVDVKTFDFSWIPHPAAPPYIYQFGTLQDPTDGPRYITPNTNEEIVKLPRIEIEEDIEEIVVVEPTVGKYYIETSLDDLVKQHESELFWALNPDIDYSNFDFSWRPSIEQAQYVHAFGSRDNINTQTYFINGPQWAKGNRDINYVEDVKIDIKVNLDMFYVDRGNEESNSRFEALKAKYGTRIQKTRYLNSWVDTINRCTNRATSSLIWVLNSELDYSDFNFDYYPNPWQMKMVHVFGTQWSHWGTTFMVNRETFREDTKYIKIIEHLSNLNFVKDNRAKATKCVHDIVVVDHGNKETQKVVDTLSSKAPDRTLTVVKYDSSYLNTLKEIIKRQPEKKEHFIWVCSSVCDYTNFDFTYICDPFARDNLHVFPSGKQKFGDTFFIDVNNAREVLSEIKSLENFNKVNYNAAIRTERLPEPVIVVGDDTHTNCMDKITDFPYATLITYDNINVPTVDIEPMNLWSNETKNIYMTSTGATRIIAPKEIKDYVKKELYEYPYIKRAPKLAMSNPIDIIFLSNGETGAEENYEHLLKITENLPNRVVRVDGINGRVAAYHAAAEASDTPWFFTVFAKLKVSPKFDWNWQPDRMQSPKHYIFHAKNPVNGLTYGHQAMIAYNKKLTLTNEGHGLDFTLDNEHEVVPLISGTANYNTDAFSTWRTAFREVIKLKHDISDVSKERLDVWLNKAQGDFAQYSIKGAIDADEYYDEVAGDFQKLKLSYEWDWLRKRFDDL